MLASGGAELVSLGAVLPFLAVLSDPQRLWQQPMVQALAARVLVFDEATSALDTDTEAAVMEAIEGLSRDLTLVMIAHRLSALQCCDRVICLSQGRVADDYRSLVILNGV